LERKKLIELIGSVFVALIFLSSYAAFGNTAQGQSNATTTAQVQTFYAVAEANATIQSYGSVMNISISCASSASASNAVNATNVSDELNGALAQLERNGSVANFYSAQANQILVQAGSANAYSLFLRLSRGIGSGTACTRFSGTANLSLPGTIGFTVLPQKSKIIVELPQSLQSYSLPVTFAENMSGTLRVLVYAYLEPNGTIYGQPRVLVV
jgi:hypothetical protein